MGRLLLPAGLLCAALATGLLAFLALRGEDDRTGPAAPAGTAERAADDTPRGRVLRPYQTTATLAEDLRDALAAGDGAFVARECWRVSEALQGKAKWTLRNVAALEASPRVRALLVLATGVHVPEERVLLDFLRDRAPVVRRAAALAAGFDADGPNRVPLVAGVTVPVGRSLSVSARATLERHLGKEADPAVREALAAALAGA